MKCKCHNITTTMLADIPELALKLGTGCDDCPLLSVEETDRRSGNDRRKEPREPPGRRREEIGSAPVVEAEPEVYVSEPVKQLPPVPKYSHHQAKDHIKVYVILDNGEQFFAKLYKKPSERLQDLLNDERRFIPVEKHTTRGRGNEDIWIFTVINKNSIVSIEER